MSADANSRFVVLDGWRGLSILFVLATHLLPLGPKAWKLNQTSGPIGMALFFTLSGFLIANFLLHRPSVVDFLIRRLARIVPLAWLAMSATLLLTGGSAEQWTAHLLFYANWPPMPLTEATGHLWSLCVEMQFYLGIALVFLFFRDRGLLWLPALCVGVTLLRIANGVHIAIPTYYRLDEILAGCILALAFNGRLGTGMVRAFERANPFWLLPLFLASCHPDSGFLNYFRPYLAALLVGWTLFNRDTRVARLLGNRVLRYLAEVSYALYVIHPLLAHTWLGSGELLEKYLKRPLLLGVIFATAHVSTFRFEQRCIEWGKRFAARLSAKPALGQESAT